MADVHTKEIRSYNMSRIRSVNTKPEMLVRKFLHAHGFRYRLHVKNLPGKPDIVLRSRNTVLLIHGCFFHGHKNCKYYKVPQTRTEFWLSKIEGNKQRDTINVRELKKQGWRVIIIHECELKPAKIEKTLNKLLNELS